jgi:hypothetical protein
MKKILFILTLFISFTVSSNDSNYVFGWTQLKNPDLKKPRGGTSIGAEVTLDAKPNPLWIKLQDPSLTKFEKDRLAILSMVGEYRVYFDFMETMGFVENYQPKQSYQSWATEYVTVVEEKKDFISLQHMTVMYFKQKNGDISDPMVMKHWRQDWQYEDDVINTYDGRRTWVKNIISPKQIEGKWSQAVYQVDDTPRYQGYGEWTHYPNFSSWAGNETWRPLPRREHSIRDDYDVMIGTNIQTITPNGWVHEQNNKKVVLAENKKVLAKEIGIARYERIKDFDWQAGIEYWEKTNPFWREVRSAINQKLDNAQSFKMKSQVGIEPLWSKLFMMADSYDVGDEKTKKMIQNLIEEYSL